MITPNVNKATFISSMYSRNIKHFNYPFFRYNMAAYAAL